MAKRLLSCLLVICMLLTSGIVYAAPSDGSPSKEEKEDMLTFTVDGAIMKVEVCAANTIHVRWAPGDTLPDKGEKTYTVDYDKSFNDFTVAEANNVLTVKTAQLTVTVDKATGKVTYRDAAGNLILEEGDRTKKAVTLPYSKNAEGEKEDKNTYEIAQRFVSDDNEALYGFGNINSTMGIKGQTVKIEQANTSKRSPMFYSNMGYGILFDIVCNGRLEWLNSNKTYQYTGIATDSMDYFFFYGPDADTVISGYRTITGQATMLPKNAFGYVQSRNRYASQDELLDAMNTFREKKIPLDTLVIDYHWWKTDGFNSITGWNESAWPDPAKMLDTLHQNHVTASISVWPTFNSKTEAYKRLYDAGFILEHGSDTGFGYTYDPSTQAARAMYWGMINDTVFSKGMDSIWIDADEPENSYWAKSNVSDNTKWGDSRMIGAMYPLLTNRGVYEGQRSIEGNTKRVNTLTRGAVAGVQRYGGQSWSGDIASTWDQLTAEIPGVINYSATGLPYFCTDTGGYFGFNVNDTDERERYLRWLQFSTFNTIMRSHGRDNKREPWQFGSTYEGYITEYINLRERLIPYIYSMAGAVTQDDYTMVRPLIFDFRTDNNVKHIQDQFMFGSQLMVCPISKSGQRSRSVYLPAGTWTNFWTGESIVSKGETITASAPLKQIPLFVRGGSIIPMGPENQYVDESQDPTEIRVYQGADGAFTLYEDEGNNYNYENGKFSTIPFSYNEATKTLTIGERKGSFDGMMENRTFKVVFVQPDYGTGGAISSQYQEGAVVAYNGSATTVTVDPDFKIPTPPLDPDTLPSPEAAPSPKATEKAMVGYWPFRQGEGAAVSDDSGYFNNGSLNQTNSWTTGKEGNAIQFSGGSADVEGTFVQVANSQSLGMTNQISFSAWVKNESSGHGNIVNKGGNSSNNPGFSFILLRGSELQLEIQSDKDATGKTQKTTAKSSVKVGNDGQWHQVGFTWKSTAAGGDGIVRIYVDGAQTSNDSECAFAGPIGQNTYPLVLGRSCENEPHSPNYFKGVMDEVSLYNYALEASDMQALAEGKDILVANVTDAVAEPANNALKLSWTDAATTEQVQVRVQSVDPDMSLAPYDKTFTMEKGKQTLTVDGLTNGEYYDVSIVAMDATGKQASGIYLVGYPNARSAAILENYIVTHGQTMYSWLVNYSSAPLTGTLTVTLNEGDAVKETLTYPISLNGNDRLQVKSELKTEYAMGQTLTLTLTDANGKALADAVTVNRTARYVEQLPVDKDALLAQLKYTVDETLYTKESVEAYKEAYRAAKIISLKASATQEEVNQALADLKAAKQNLKISPDAGVMMTFSKSEGTFTNLMNGKTFYIDWKAADGLTGAQQAGAGVDLSGSAENGSNPDMHFRATVTYASTDKSIDPATIAKRIQFRLRSSHQNGIESLSDFAIITPSQQNTPDSFEVDIPLTAFGKGPEDERHKPINWADVKELIITSDVADNYQNNATLSLTLSNIWIQNTNQSTPTVDKAALTAAIAGVNAVLADGKAYTADTKTALQTALTAAQAILNDTAATQAQVDEATAALNTALAALQYAKGDVNGDGKTDVTDALMALQAAAGKVTLTATEAAATNADGDAQGAITAADALLILKAATGQIEHI